ncbi:MAG: cadherin-like domain-containing protein [Lentisphaeraceae bacterium]|nr:cadherin-like domain-containing protein [Lentisphaeraceae bacterium]
MTQAANGTVTFNGTSVSYTPNRAWNGVDSFTYTVNDGNAGTAVATVTVTVNVVEVSSKDLVLEYSFESGNAADTSPFGIDNSGSLGGNSSVVTKATRGQVLAVDGDGDFVDVANSANINLSTVTARTISLFFNATSVSARQCIFEEGGTYRGFSIYIDNGSVYAGAWGMSSTTNAYPSTAVSANEWNHLALVLDSAAGNYSVYLNGVVFASLPAASMSKHNGAIGIAQVDGKTRFHDGKSSISQSYDFAGKLDNLLIYNRALSASELANLSLK